MSESRRMIEEDERGEGEGEEGGKRENTKWKSAPLSLNSETCLRVQTIESNSHIWCGFP